MGFIKLEAGNFSAITEALSKANLVLDNAETMSRNARNSLSMEVRSRQNIEEMIQSGIRTMQTQKGRVTTLKGLTAESLAIMSEEDKQCAKKTSGMLEGIGKVLSSKIINTSSITNVAVITHHATIAALFLTNRKLILKKIFFKTTDYIKRIIEPYKPAVIQTVKYVYTDKDGNVSFFTTKEAYEDFLQKEGKLYFQDEKGKYHLFDSQEEYNQYIKDNHEYWVENNDGEVVGFKTSEGYEAYLKEKGYYYIKKNDGQYEVYADYNAYKSATLDEINSRVDLNNDWDGKCGAMAYNQLEAQGIKFTRTEHGKDLANDILKQDIDGYKQTSVYSRSEETPFTESDVNASKLAFESLINSEHQPITNVVISMAQGGNFSDAENGHVVLISKIENGRVYFVDNTWNCRQPNGKYTATEMSIEDFEAAYITKKSKYGYTAITGITHIEEDK